MENITLVNVASKATADAHYANVTDAHNLTVRLAAKADLVGGTVPQAQLPSYVDDILEFANLAAFPITGETGKIYMAIDTGKQYRWSGSAYIQISNGFIASTDDVPEGSNLYYTLSNFFQSILSGFSSGANTPIANGINMATVLARFQGQITARPNENATTIAAIHNAAAPKTVLVDADEVPGQDSASSFSLIRTTWADVKYLFKTYFDTLYAPKRFIQMVTGSTGTYATSSSSTFSTTGLSATITPTTTSSKIWVSVKINGVGKFTGNTSCALRLLRGASVIAVIDGNVAKTGGTVAVAVGTSGIDFLDSPATTSATTYSVEFASAANIAAVDINEFTALQTTLSTITLIEYLP